MRIVLLVLTICWSLFLKAQDNQVEIHFSKNMEFFGYIVELGDPSDNDPNHPITKIIYQYPENRNNPLLMEIFTLAADMDYASIVNLLYFLPEFPLEDSFELAEKRAQQIGYDTQEEMHMLSNLITKVNQFYKESKFESIWEDLAPHRAELLAYMNDNKPSQEQMETMEAFYQSDYAQYEVVPSFTIWSGPGWGINNGRGHKATFVLGPMGKNYDFTNKSRFLYLSVHEFGHSFVNHVVLPNEEPIEKTRSLFGELKANMSRQGYSNWESCMIEHFVRAGEIIIPELMGNTEGNEALLKNYVENRQYVYLPFIIEKLKEYRLEKEVSYEEAVKKTLIDIEKAYVSK